MPRVVVVVAGVVVEIVVTLTAVVDTVEVGTSSSMAFSEDEAVPFIGSCRQQRILAVGHCTSSRTSSHINVANACTHTPGQSAVFAVLVREFKKPAYTNNTNVTRDIFKRELQEIQTRFWDPFFILEILTVPVNF